MNSARTVRPRDRDDSLAKKDLHQHRVPPESLLWKYWGDRRRRLLGARAVTMQLMHAQLSQAVSDHSVLFDPGGLIERLKRTVGPMDECVYGEQPEKAGLVLRNFHKKLKGVVDHEGPYHGSAYHGLNAETFYWAHATFVDVLFVTVERFIRPLNDGEKEQLYRECCDWFSLYGVDSRAQPPNYRAFREYWDRTVRTELVSTPAGRFPADLLTEGVTRAFPTPAGVNPILWSTVLRPAIDRLAMLVGLGSLDPVVRRKLGLRWTTGQEIRYRMFCRAVRALGPLWERFVPLHRRYSPSAVEGFARAHVDPRHIESQRRVQEGV